MAQLAPQLQGFLRSDFQVYLQNAIPLGSEMSQDNNRLLWVAFEEGLAPLKPTKMRPRGAGVPQCP